jgi:2',3'-cyclic-nucleotide 2'-phosphodiesterase (5'-nucleotidase family)
VSKLRVEKGAEGPFLAKVEGSLRLVRAGPGSPSDAHVAAMVDRYAEQIKPIFAEAVGETEVDLVTSKTSETNIGNLMTDAMRSAAKADIAFQNSGGIRVNLPKGKITGERVYELLPFDNAIVTMDMSGSAVLQVLEQGGGGEYGLVQMSGASVVYDFRKKPGERVVKAEVGGKSIEPGRTYRVVTNDFAATGGDRLLAFQQGKNVVYGDNLRDVFVSYLKKISPVAPKVEGRITVLR